MKKYVINLLNSILPSEKYLQDRCKGKYDSKNLDESVIELEIKSDLAKFRKARNLNKLFQLLTQGQIRFEHLKTIFVSFRLKLIFSF